MANYLPLLLIGGGAAYMVVSGKKKARAPFLWVSDDCKEVKIFGLKPEQLEEKAQDETLKKKYKGSVQKWGREVLDLEGWFQNRPGIKVGELGEFAREITAWRYPQCDVGDDMQPGSAPFFVYVAVYAAVIEYVLANDIVSVKDALEDLRKGLLGDMVPLPDGVSAAMVHPAAIRMVLS